MCSPRERTRDLARRARHRAARPADWRWWDYSVCMYDKQYPAEECAGLNPLDAKHTCTRDEFPGIIRGVSETCAQQAGLDASAINARRSEVHQKQVVLRAAGDERIPALHHRVSEARGVLQNLRWKGSVLVACVQLMCACLTSRKRGAAACFW